MTDNRANQLPVSSSKFIDTYLGFRTNFFAITILCNVFILVNLFTEASISLSIEFNANYSLPPFVYTLCPHFQYLNIPAVNGSE